MPWVELTNGEKLFLKPGETLEALQARQFGKVRNRQLLEGPSVAEVGQAWAGAAGQAVLGAAMAPVQGALNQLNEFLNKKVRLPPALTGQVASEAYLAYERYQDLPAHLRAYISAVQHGEILRQIEVAYSLPDGPERQACFTEAENRGFDQYQAQLREWRRSDPDHHVPFMGEVNSLPEE